MKTQIEKIKPIDKVAFKILKIVSEKSNPYTFLSGKATEECIQKESRIGEKRPFTFTSLPDDDYLEFTIKF
ncbi:MAG: hypothetical protein H0V01_10550 [Bacteroidetes bacterium]|nr:hypothetical protein [Bacteroidota bacterium]HET6245099.1 hypothetical protein [Bacteroidia bacterium]